MQTPRWFLQLIIKPSVFGLCKPKRIFTARLFLVLSVSPFILFLFHIPFLLLFSFYKPLWLTTILKTNTVQSVPEEKRNSSSGCQSCGRWMLRFVTEVQNLLPIGGAGWEGRTEMRNRPRGKSVGGGSESFPGLEGGQQHEKHLVLLGAYTM